MSENSQHILQLKQITNLYGGKPLLQDVSFSLERGEILCLLGPSGSGKTTLLRIIAGLEQEESGVVLVNGRDIRPVPPHKRKIGMMFQNYALFPHKNVWQNVAFGLEMQNCSAGETETRVRSMLELVGLSGFGGRKVEELSGGEQQRVALARSLAPEPELLLLDEPLGSLDRILRERLTIEIRSILRKLGVTAVFVTHDQAEAFTVADKVAVLQDGVLQQFAHPETLYRFPKNVAVARFLGFTNYVSGEINQKGNFSPALTAIGEVRVGNQHQSQAAVLLLRPDGAVLASAGEEKAGLLLTGTVKYSRFQGATYRVAMETEGYVLVFDLPIDPAPPAHGETIHLQLHPDSLVVLERAESDERLEKVI